MLAIVLLLAACPPSGPPVVTDSAGESISTATEPSLRSLLRPQEGHLPSRAALEAVSPDPRGELTALLNDPDPQVRTSAAICLGAWAGEVEELRALLASRAVDRSLPATDRSGAIHGLGATGPDAVEVVRPLLNSAEPLLVQTAAVRVLASFESERPALEVFANDGEAHPAARQLVRTMLGLDEGL